MSDYKYSVKIRDKEIKFRKWKVKDRKLFTASIKSKDAEKTAELVYNCLEDKSLPLTAEEFKYLMVRIRSTSLGDDITFDLECNECEGAYEYITTYTDLLIPNFKKYGVITAGDVSFKMGEIANKEFYDDAIKQCEFDEEKFFIDFMYHVKELNGSDAFKFDTLYEFVNEMDLDIGESIFKQWNEMRFTLDDKHTLECPHCKNVELLKFDVLPKFFPDDWFN
jgi:hypothetical protein